MRRGKPRVLGPYYERGWWRLVVIEGSVRTARKMASEADALKLKAKLEVELAGEVASLGKVLDRYEQHLHRKGNKAVSVAGTMAKLRRFFEGLAELPQLTPRKASQLYDRLSTEPSERTGKPLATDSHRNILAEAKTFASWCVKGKLLKANPFTGVEPVGKRQHGKPQLRLDEARAFCRHAFDQADAGDVGAVAALTALLMALRAGEIVGRVVRDVDDGGQVLWIPDAKTPAGKRTVEVPIALQPYFRKLVEGRRSDELLFGEHWRDWPRKQVQRICKLAKVPMVCAHSMRGLHSTLAIRAGASPQIVAHSLGHEKPSTTLLSYAAPGSLQHGQLRSVSDRLNPSPTFPMLDLDQLLQKITDGV